MMVERLSSIYPTGYRATTWPMPPAFRLDAAPINIVSNPAASDPTVRNGIILFRLSYGGYEDV